VRSSSDREPRSTLHSPRPFIGACSAPSFARASLDARVPNRIGPGDARRRLDYGLMRPVPYTTRASTEMYLRQQSRGHRVTRMIVGSRFRNATGFIFTSGLQRNDGKWIMKNVFEVLKQKGSGTATSQCRSGGVMRCRSSGSRVTNEDGRRRDTRVSVK
jgi:hypothetical protein